MNPRLSPLAIRRTRRTALALILAIGIASADVFGQDVPAGPALGASALSLIEHARQGNPGFAAARAEAAAARERATPAGALPDPRFELELMDLLRHLGRTPPAWRTSLRQVKNAAYAWRQLVFYLSLSTSDEVEAFFAGAELELAKTPAGFRERFRPALIGLRSAARGEALDAHGGCRFFGWTVGPHWLLARPA